MTWEIIFYQDRRGESPALRFLKELPERSKAKAYKWLQLLEEEGPNLPRPYADTLDEKIRELRISHGHLEIRLLYFFDGQKIVVSHGFLKKTQVIPPREIDRAIKNWKEYFERRKNQ